MELRSGLRSLRAFGSVEADSRPTFKWIVEQSWRRTVQTVVFEYIKEALAIVVIRQWSIPVQDVGHVQPDV
jgi:hypothetical protein